MKKETSNNKLFLIGAILSSIGFGILPVPLGIASFVLSIMLITREEIGKGVYLLIFTVLSCGIGTFIGMMVAQTGISGTGSFLLLFITIVLIVINISIYVAISNTKNTEQE